MYEKYILKKRYKIERVKYTLYDVWFPTLNKENKAKTLVVWKWREIYIEKEIKNRENEKILRNIATTGVFVNMLLILADLLHSGQA